LSDRVSLSPRACLDRVRRLEKTGIINGYMAQLEPRKLGGLLTISRAALDGGIDTFAMVLRQFEAPVPQN
jgi:Lrp/AsnC family transcriptional regulator, leucine-responsive regulatory protein